MSQLRDPSTDMLFFISDRRIGAIRPDGSGECMPPFLRLVGVIPGTNRFLVSGNNNHIASILTADLDGGNREEIWSGPDYAYGTSLSPDGRKAAHHVVGAPPTWNFRITWSPDGARLAFIRADVAVVHRLLAGMGGRRPPPQKREARRELSGWLLNGKRGLANEVIYAVGSKPACP